MGWRAAKASGNASMPVDTGGSFAEGFASTFVPMFNAAVSDYASEQREKRMLELKESLYRQRPRASTTRSEERKSQEELRDITALASQLNVSPAKAAELYYSHDGDASMAADSYNLDDKSGLIVGEVTPSSPVQDDVIPETDTPDTTDDLSATEPAPAVGQEEVEVSSAPEASTQEGFAAVPEEQPAFEAFEVASIGTIADDMSLITKSEEEEDDAAVQVAANIDADIEVAEATGQNPTVTYQDIQQGGATGEETRQILKAGTRLPQVYAIPEPSKITTLQEAQAAMDVLDARSSAIGGIDDYDRNVRPMLEARISSLTELPDLGQMLQNNERDRLQEFYENGYRQYENVSDPAQLEAHRQRAAELLSQSSSMPEIPQTLADLRAMQNRLRSGEFRGVPTEWMEALNTATRTAELQERYGDRLTVDYIMSDERSERELNILRSAVVNAMGEDSPLVNEIDLALGTPVAADVPNIADVRANNWRSLRDASLDAGDPEQAQRITTLGQEWEAADAAGDNTRMEQLAEVSSVLARANTEIRDTNAQAEAYLGAVDSAYRLNAILQENRNINYFFGGALPSAIMSAVGEISAVSSLLNGNDVSVTDAMTSVENFEKDIERRFLAGDISEDARAYAIYKAQETRLAFQIARLQQGPAGVISNQDFDSARDQVRSSANPDTFEASIRGLVGAEEVKVRSSVDSLLRNPQIQIAQELQNGLGVDFTAGALRTIEERAADVGAEQALAWMQGGPAIAPQTGNTPDPAAAITEMSDDVFRSTIAGLYDPETNTFDYSGYSEAEKEAIRQRLLNLKGSN